ncbi:MAG: preprotein translocase subunit SecA, partial [Nonlabens sp.]
MGLLDSVLKVFVGDKSKKDIKEIQPIVDKILKFEPGLEQLNFNELRYKTTEFRERIAAGKADTLSNIASLKETAENEEDIDRREEIYNEIDQLQEVAYLQGEE